MICRGRWYDAMGGLGLEITKDGEHWFPVGYIRKNGNWFNVHVNPQQDKGYICSTHKSLSEAKEAFLKRYGATEESTLLEGA